MAGREDPGSAPDHQGAAGARHEESLLKIASGDPLLLYEGDLLPHIEGVPDHQTEGGLQLEDGHAVRPRHLDSGIVRRGIEGIVPQVIEEMVMMLGTGLVAIKIDLRMGISDEGRRMTSMMKNSRPKQGTSKNTAA